MDNPRRKSSPVLCTIGASRGRAKHGSEWGKLPAISLGIYNNLFFDKPDFMVQNDVNFMSTHGDRTRFFDCGTSDIKEEIREDNITTIII